MTQSGQMTTSDVQALLQDSTLAGDWTLDAAKSTIGLRSKSMWGLVSVKGVFREVTGQGAVSAAGGVRSVTVRDQTRPISFPAKVSVLGPDEVQLDAEVQVNRADFGLTWNQMGMASMANTITMHAVFAKR